jgi:hypothetical protein
MQTERTPADGDIVVRQETRDARLVYVLRIAPGPDQYVLGSCEEAVAHALILAKRDGVRAWFTRDEDDDFAPLGISFGLPAGEGPSSQGQIADCERRLHALIDRLHAEYVEMPGLRLTPKQVQRLCGVERAVCKLLLEALVDEGFLCVKRDGAYVRLADGHHPRPARAYLRIDVPPSKKAS